MVSYHARDIGWLGTKVLHKLDDGRYKLDCKGKANISNMSLYRPKRKLTPERSPPRDAGELAASPR
eukprot:5955187-Pyramimonas_sp.AAC.1